MLYFGFTFFWLVFWTLALYLALTIKPRASESFSKGWSLDFWIFIFVFAPPMAGLFSSPMSLLFILLAQGSFLFLFCEAHEFYFRKFKKVTGKRLLGVLGKSLGRTRVVLGFYITLLAIPVFFVIRVGQLTVYPLLHWVLRFPAYKSEEWIQLSRQKYHGLVGIDLLWCLYCEWAAGVYALGGEMIRNNESFWCPIRFYDQKHCENCTLDFPDLKKWIPQNESIDKAERLLAQQYPPGQEVNAWYDHPSRK